jgi:hypothetical protein
MSTVLVRRVYGQVMILRRRLTIGAKPGLGFHHSPSLRRLTGFKDSKRLSVSPELGSLGMH